MRIAICEADDGDSEQLKYAISRYSDHAEQPMVAGRYTKGGNLLAAWAEDIVCDVVITEAQLPDMTGIELARSLREKGYYGDIVLTAQDLTHASEGYEVDAKGYLLKPLSDETLFRALDKVKSRLQRACYPLLFRGQVARLPYCEILYIESQNTRCVFHCANGAQHTVYKTLSDIEAELTDGRFLRCHQSFLVNLDCVSYADDCFELYNGERIRIRQRSRREMVDIYAEYLRTGHR